MGYDMLLFTRSITVVLSTRANGLWWRHQMATFTSLLALLRGIHLSPVNSPHKGQWRATLLFLWSAPEHKRLSKQSRRQWFETPSHSLWRHCKVEVNHLWVWQILLICISDRIKLTTVVVVGTHLSARVSVCYTAPQPTTPHVEFLQAYIQCYDGTLPLCMSFLRNRLYLWLSKSYENLWDLENCWKT